MKRFLLFLAVMIIFSSLFAFACTADEIEEELVLPPATEEVEEVNTLFTRLWEYVDEHKVELIDYAIGIAIFVLAWITRNVLGKGNGAVIKVLSSLKEDSVNNTTTQHTVIDTVGKMVTGYNELRESYEQYGKTEDERNRVVGALVAQTTAILEILTTVYCSNSKLPQGAKDLVQLTYANCLKAVEDDEQLIAIITAVRNNIGAASVVDIGGGEPDSEAEV